MMTLRALKIAGLPLCSCCASVHAYADTEPAMVPAEADVAASVNVMGIRDPDWKPYSAMLKGVNCFEEKHGLAPTAEVNFILQPRHADVDMHTLRLRLEGDETSSQIPLEPGWVH